MQNDLTHFWKYRNWTELRSRVNAIIFTTFHQIHSSTFKRNLQPFGSSLKGRNIFLSTSEAPISNDHIPLNKLLMEIWMVVWHTISAPQSIWIVRIAWNSDIESHNESETIELVWTSDYMRLCFGWIPFKPADSTCLSEILSTRRNANSIKFISDVVCNGIFHGHLFTFQLKIKFQSTGTEYILERWLLIIWHRFGC